MNQETMILFGIMGFLGLAFGWFFKKFNPIMIFIAFVLFSSVIEFMVKLDTWLLTLPFMVGFSLQMVKVYFSRGQEKK